MFKVVEKFLKYVSFDTKSEEESTTVPSTSGQLTFAKELVGEMKSIGLKDTAIDENGYIMATLIREFQLLVSWPIWTQAWRCPGKI